MLRDQGVSYQAYISQISYLLFLKMDEERVEQIGEASMLPDGARWADIKELSGEALGATYGKLLEKLSKQPGIIGAIFLKAQNEIQDPAKLKRLVGLIDSETWLALPVDVKGSIYEGLLARNAEDVKSGAGQYFTPRPVIEAMVALVDPKPHRTVHDPACGTAGFLLAAWEHMKQHRSTSCWRATRSTSTSSGSRTTPWTIPTCCRRPTKSPLRSSKAWRRHWSASGTCRRRWGRGRLEPTVAPRRVVHAGPRTDLTKFLL